MTMTQRVGTWVAATVLSVAVMAVANAQEPTRPSAAIAQAAKPAGGVDQGIKVHGRWTIDVRNPDGSLASRHEFNNALQLLGAGALQSVLLRRQAPGMWTVRISGDLCAGASGTGCILTETDANLFPPELAQDTNVFRTLTIGPSSNSPGARLQGTFTAAHTGTILSVATYIGMCSDPSTATCTYAQASGPFSSTGLSSPVPVTSGQIVQVTVIISFS